MARSTPATDRLAAVPLFSALSKKELTQVDRAADELDVKTGQEIVTQGRTGHEFFLILSGEATVQRDGQDVATLGPDQYFGELALLDRGPRSATVIAKTDMKLLVLGQREFGGLLDSVPGIAAKLLANVAQRLRAADTGSSVD
jgi:CRP/FNR family transcriptional regulator, cyclic AMP receptor protein